MRRYNGKIKGQRYIADKTAKKVHDLDYEANDCDIDEIVDSGKMEAFVTLDAAHRSGYESCRHCIEKNAVYGSGLSAFHSF